MIACAEVEPNRIKLEKLEIKDKSGNKSKKTTANGDSIWIPKYLYQDGDKDYLYIVTDWITIKDGGYPSHHDQYHPDPLKRDYIRVAYDSDQKNAMDLRNMAERIDKYMSSDAVATELFKNAKSLMEYESIIRVSKPKIDLNNPDKIPTKKLDFTKFKLNKKWPSTDFTTKIFERTSRDDDNDEPKELPSRNAEEMEKAVPYGSDIRFILQWNKVWAGDRQGKLKYGNGFKIVQMEVIRKKQGDSEKERFSKNCFGVLKKKLNKDESKYEKPVEAAETENSTEEYEESEEQYSEEYEEVEYNEY